MVIDNHRAHHFNDVKFLLAALSVYPFFLPASSSTLNPIEHLWVLYTNRLRRAMLASGQQMISDEQFNEIVI